MCQNKFNVFCSIAEIVLSFSNLLSPQKWSFLVVEPLLQTNSSPVGLILYFLYTSSLTQNLQTTDQGCHFLSYKTCCNTETYWNSSLIIYVSTMSDCKDVIAWHSLNFPTYI